jgi:hypothetical protein
MSDSGGNRPERRKLRRELVGGARATDPPLTTRDCAEFMDVGTDWIRAAIEEGVTFHGVVVKLGAYSEVLNDKRLIRISLEQFVTFLRAIAWPHVPKYPPTD